MFGLAETITSDKHQKVFAANSIFPYKPAGFLFGTSCGLSSDLT